jgi:stage II sporulation protein AA (anti-sigma F factor antagonist)
MQVNMTQRRRALVARIEGEIDLHTALALKESISKALRTHPRASSLVLVLSEVTFIDSSGLGAILYLHRIMQPMQGRVILVSPIPQVKRVLEFSGLAKILDILDSEALAVLRS